MASWSAKTWCANTPANTQSPRANERMLTDGFYAEVSLEYDPVIAQERNGRPFSIAGLRQIHLGGALSGRDIEGVNKTVSVLIKLLFPDPSWRSRMRISCQMSIRLTGGVNLVDR